MELVLQAKRLGVIDVNEYLKLAAFAGRQDLIVEQKKGDFEDLAYSAVLGGHFDLLKWLHQHDHSMHHVMECASQTGNKEIIEWGLDHNLELSSDCMFRAIKCQGIEMMNWLKDKGCPMDGSCYAAAIKKNDFEKLNWLFQNECEFTETEVLLAVSKGELAQVKWFVEKDPSVNLEQVMETAAPAGALDILEWGLENGLSFSPECMAAAVCQGTLETMKWLRSRGCPWNFKAYQCAAHSQVGKKADRIAKVEWLDQGKCPYGNLTKAMVLGMIDQGPSEITQGLAEVFARMISIPASMVSAEPF